MRGLALGAAVAVPLSLLAACGHATAPRAGSPAGSAPGPHAAGTPAGARPGISPGTGANAGSIAARAVLGAEATAITNSMSVPQKVGQLLVATVPGTSAASGGAALVRTYHLGGVIYFDNNIRTAAQTAALSSGLQKAALAQRPAVPLLIGTDQEGALVSRLARVVTEFPDQMAVGATRKPAMVEAEEQATGTQLRALGINLDYAPVADVNTDPANPIIGIRSFGSHPGLVSAMTSAAVAGFHAAGVAATAKHFPGHGDTSTDSHTGLPVVGHTLRQWRRIDAPPFQAAIKAGVDEVMIGQIAVPALDSAGGPASLSHRIVTGYLRDRLGYQGVITTDALNMAGVTMRHTNAQIAIQAIQAGCDQLLMPVSVPQAYQTLLAAVRGGQISAARLDASVRRIVALKLARGLMTGPGAAPATGRNQRTPAGAAVARRIADRSVTMVKNAVVNRRRVLPLTRNSVYLAGPAAPALRAALTRAGGRLVTGPGAADVIVVATQDAVFDPAQRRLVAGLLATRRPVVVVATGAPYDLGLFPGAAAGLATYSAAGASLEAAAQVLTGRISPAGRLPVAVPRAGGGVAYRYGTGLRYSRPAVG